VPALLRWLCQDSIVLGGVEARDHLQSRQPIACGFYVTARSLSEHEFRRDENESFLRVVPPLPRHCLLGSDDEIARRSRCQVANDGCFHVNGGFGHASEFLSESVNTPISYRY